MAGRWSTSATSTPPKRRPPPTLAQSAAAPTPPSYCSLTRLPLPLASRRYVRQGEREGLTLVTSGSTSGYKGVYYHPKERGSKKYQLKVTSGGKQVSLGRFATAEQAALFYARREAGRDTSDHAALPPPPPPPAPSTAAGTEAIQQAGGEVGD